MSPITLLAAVVLAAVFSYALTPVAGRLSLRLGAIDQPGPRKIHQVPIPRLGGIAVLVSVGLTVFMMAAFGTGGVSRRMLGGLALGLAPVLLVSVIDDIRSVPALMKFAAHGVGAAIAVGFGFRLGNTIHVFGIGTSIAVVAIPISWIWIIGVTNAFNLTDGLDGLSAGLALISASSLAAVALVAGDSTQGFMSLVLVGALAGFLPSNTFPATIFFGDTGAACIGFMLACLGLWGTSRLSSGMAVLVPIFVMGVPVADALVAIARRTLGAFLRPGKGGVFKPDQEHIHHRLLRKGFDHQSVVRLLYAVGLGAAVIGVLSIFLTSGRAAFVVATVLLAATLGIRELDYEEFNIVRNGLALRMYDMPVLRTGAFRVFIDLALVALATYAAFALKFDEWTLARHWDTAVSMLVITSPITVVVFLALGLYRRSWRHVTIEDLLLSGAASVASSCLDLLFVKVILPDGPGLAYFIIYALVLTALVLTVRSSFRLLRYWKEKGNTGERVLVYGADLEGAMACQQLFWNRDGAFRPVGFIDDDPKNAKRVLSGFEVLGNIDALERLVATRRVSGLVIGSSRITAEQIALATTMCGRAGISLKRLRIDLRALTTSGPKAEAVQLTLTAALGGADK